MAISREFALKKFNNVLKNVRYGGTPIREVISVSLDTLDNIKKVITMLPPHTAIWQHNMNYHFVAIYIEKGRGYSYSRDFLDLISDGVDTEEKFLDAWESINGSKEIGKIPKTQHQATKTSRQKQSSYIVADVGAGENKQSKIEGKLNGNGVDRTHLISSQITGIENHKGLLIDYDSWLNRIPINKFEIQALKISNYRDIVWTTMVYQKSDGLHFKCIIYNENFEILMQNEWIDDRWKYIWKFDAYQVNKKQ
ncbi:hypothetical protein FVI60_08945 [Campylobacter jejuni]|nr:hypothetical protein [Campylobacter jejuni]